eukprot:scaffold187707_cov28-Tisochrysis_lutea.AAC.6
MAGSSAEACQCRSAASAEDTADFTTCPLSALTLTSASARARCSSFNLASAASRRQVKSASTSAIVARIDTSWASRLSHRLAAASASTLATESSAAALL